MYATDFNLSKTTQMTHLTLKQKLSLRAEHWTNNS